VLRVTQVSEATFHIASAIGTLYESVLRQDGSHEVPDDGALALALQQCNRSINLLTAPAQTTSPAGPNAGEALITSVLFAVFEEMHGDTMSAAIHLRQAWVLQRHCERLTCSQPCPLLVDPAATRPIIALLEGKAKALLGRTAAESDTSDEPPLPDVSTLHSLDHASWTVHSIYMSILICGQDTGSEMGPAEVSARSGRKQSMYGPWLKQWEQAFGNLLARETTLRSTRDSHRAKVLRVHHLIASIMAAVDYSRGREEWAPYDSECKTVIELSADALDFNSPSLRGEYADQHLSYLFTSPGLLHCLFFVMVRSPFRSLQCEAHRLLSRHSPHRSQGWIADRAVAPSSLSPYTPQDTWTMDQWIEFSEKARLDVATFMYFARLPTSFVDRLEYPHVQFESDRTSGKVRSQASSVKGREEC